MSTPPPPEKAKPSRVELAWARWMLELLSPSRVAAETTRVVRRLGEITTTADLDLVLLRRTLWHAVVVGAVAGLFGALFFGALELAQQLLLERFAGYVPLRAHGEPDWWPSPVPTPFRPWLLILLPALGGLVAGQIIRLAPEARGGGTDAVIDAFHRGGAVIRRRVVIVKALASLATLGSGGAGGREGPTMQIGGALGAALGRVLGASARERRVLLLAGVAAGIAAVFRTPLGAALLAVEVLYQDGFESEALVPCILASVVSYSIVITLYGDSTLLAHAARYPFVPAHLPLYAALALGVSVVALGFTSALRWVKKAVIKLPVADWVRPGVGGLAVGLVAVAAIEVLGAGASGEGRGFGILGGGYGAVQLAISGGAHLPDGWPGVQLLLVLCAAKGIASALTIGSGGSAGDFAPSLAIGGLFGGAFGRAASLLLDDPRIDPGAFALVGMGAFYGGIAHVPLAALVLVCELAGSYDLLVPLMLAEGVAFVVLRKRSLYEAQVRTLRDSPVHRRELGLPLLQSILVQDVMTPAARWSCFAPDTNAENMLVKATFAEGQQVFPVLDPSGQLKGMVTADALHDLARQPELESWLKAVDIMQRPASVRPTETLAEAAKGMLEQELRAIAVLDDAGQLLGFVDQSDVARALLEMEGSSTPGLENLAAP